MTRVLSAPPRPGRATPRPRLARPVRVTHVVHALEGGGLESLVATMTRDMDRARVITSVVPLSGAAGRIGESLTGVAERVQPVRPLPGLSMVAPLALAHALRTTQPDVVHVHSGVWYKGALAARLAGAAAVVFTEHGREHDDPPLARWLDRRAAHWTDTVVPVSRRLHEYLRTRVGIPFARMLTIENGVDTNRFTPACPHVAAAARRELGVPVDAVVVGSVGRLEPVKGYDRLLRAVAHLRATSGDAALAPLHVVLCGDGGERARLQALAGSLGIGEAVHFTGWLTEPVDAYHAMDLFALPSHSEGLSVSLLEAMACGLPVVVTPVGANAEILGSAMAAQVSRADEPATLASALAHALLPLDHRRRLGITARARVVARFSQARMLEAYMSLYERLAAPSIA